MYVLGFSAETAVQYGTAYAGHREQGMRSWKYEKEEFHISVCVPRDMFSMCLSL